MTAIADGGSDEMFFYRRDVMDGGRFRLIVILFVSFFLCQLGATANGDDASLPSDDQTVRERNETSRLADAELKRWRFTSTGDRAAPTISAEPAMRWSYFDTGRYYGNLYIITENKKPVSVFALFRWFHPVSRSYVCATALDDSPIVASRNGNVVWRPRGSGLKWQPLPDSPPPARSSLSRLVQMRRIAREFSGEVSESPISGQPAMKKLRLLTQPIYRYSTETEDGAIFAFANGTTPAVLLCVEADLSANTIGWRYGLARRWSFESRMNHGNEEVWTAPRAQMATTSNGPYYLSILPE